jgi:hypothetical protein
MTPLGVQFTTLRVMQQIVESLTDDSSGIT